MKKRFLLSAVLALFVLALPAIVFAGGKKEETGTTTEQSAAATEKMEEQKAAMMDDLKPVAPPEGWAYGFKGLEPIKEKGKCPPGIFKKDPPWTFGVAIQGYGNSWRVQAAELMRYELENNPKVEKVIMADAGWDLNKQISDVQDMIAQGVDVILLDPNQYGAYEELHKEAKENGILMIDYWQASVPYTEMPDDRFGILTSGYFDGYIEAAWLAAKLNGKGNIWALQGIAGLPYTNEAWEGALDAFKGTDIEVVESIYADWGYDKAKQAIEALILTNPDIDGVWSNGAEMTRALVDVFQENGMEIPPVTGQNYNGFFKVWIENDLDAMASAYNPTYGNAAAKLAYDVLEGKSVYYQYLYRHYLITEEDLDREYLPDLSDAYWSSTDSRNMPEEFLQDLYGK